MVRAGCSADVPFSIAGQAADPEAVPEAVPAARRAAVMVAQRARKVERLDNIQLDADRCTLLAALPAVQAEVQAEVRAVAQGLVRRAQDLEHAPASEHDPVRAVLAV